MVASCARTNPARSIVAAIYVVTLSDPPVLVVNAARLAPRVASGDGSLRNLTPFYACSVA